MTFTNPSVRSSQASGTSVLDRLSSQSSFHQSGALSTTQSQVDGLVTRFVDEAANPRTLAAITMGSAAYRFGRLGVMALGEGRLAAMPLRMLSVGVGLGTEVTAFEASSRAFATMAGENTNPNLWNWNGEGGLRQGLLSSLITFGMLKGAGYLGRESNVVFQHAFSSTAMVAGHQTASLFGIISRPEGSFAEQLLHAEATNLQLGAGTNLLHTMAPGVHALERGLDLSLRLREINGRPRFPSVLNSPEMAIEGMGSTRENPGLDEEGNADPNRVGAQVLMMSRPKRESGKDSSGPRVRALQNLPNGAENLSKDLSIPQSQLLPFFEGLNEMAREDSKMATQALEGFRRLFQHDSGSEELLREILNKFIIGGIPHLHLLRSALLHVSADFGQGRLDVEGSRKALKNARFRVELIEQLEPVTEELRAIDARFEEGLKRIRFQIYQNRNQPELWELYGRLLPKQSQVSRRFVTGEAALQPGGGGEKWSVPRLEQVLASLRRFAQEAHETYRELELSKLPPALEIPGFSPRLTALKTFEEISILFRNLPWSDANLGKALLKMIPRERREDSWILQSLEGVHALLYQRPADERQAVEALMKVLTTPPNDFEAVRTLFEATSNFQLGLMSRDEVLNVVRPCRDFYSVYPQARGPFFGLFFTSQFSGPRGGRFVEAPLNLARSRLEAGDQVTLEPVGSIGYSTLVVENALGEKNRYATGIVLQQVKHHKDFNRIATRLMQELMKARENDFDEQKKSRIYIEIPRLERNVTPERLRFWGRLFMDQAMALATEELVSASVLHAARAFNADRQKGSAPSKEKEQIDRQYWWSIAPQVDQIEISYIAENGEKRLEVISKDSPNSERMIGELLVTVTDQEARSDPKRFPNILLLGHMMRDSGRSHEAVEFLRTRTGSQAPKRIRELYRDIFLEHLEMAFPREEASPDDVNRVFRFIDIFFDRLFREEELRKLLSLEHPYYDMAPLGLERHGDALRINFPVVGIYPPTEENVADFVVDISIPLNDSRWKVEMVRADVDPNHRGRHIGVFVMDRIFSMLREMGITELTTEGNEDGRYAWLRMGADFVNPAQQSIVEHEIRNHLKNRLGKGLPLTRSRTLTSGEIADFLSKVDKDELRDFLARHWFISPHYRWNLQNDSNAMKRFRSYFEAKKKSLLQTGGVVH